MTAPAPVVPDQADLSGIMATLAFAYSSLDGIANAPDGFGHREMRQRGWYALAEINKRLREIDKKARRRTRDR